MLYKTRGIVLHQTKYSENFLIVNIYTEELGRQSFLVRGIRAKRPKFKSNLFQALFPVSLEMTYQPKKQLQTIREITLLPEYLAISTDTVKNSIVFFIAEILYKTLKEEEKNSFLFKFMFDSIKLLGGLENGIANFHLYFMLQYSRYLGFFPQNNYSKESSIFDMMNGGFVKEAPIHSHYLHTEGAKLFASLFNLKTENLSNFKISHQNRRWLLERLVDFYRLHIENFGRVKTIDVLKTIFEV